MIRSILVACTGNICRSPMAAGILQARLPHVDVSSAGTGAMVDSPADPLARQVLATAARIDIDAHRARQITAELVLKAEIVLVMETLHKRWIISRFPAAAGRTFLLGEFGGFEVADPYLGTEQDFIACYASIVRGVDAWVEKIARLAS
ncbi:hypothetical protein BTH42_33465 [Burkholderia sp. SRS-W-2-2016]|uniref:low molecular weight protein-tyrosine-phosphatase n=1 Tax=Burkholderia sp. SRS-W-2-2016 TaxID=1926878 RepID=UPI00094B180C|nr:low molecular weight protein-tyrosine-phosphatase [Burkholderia sp. SRS-W-2-2016]OLL27323.1 hypothetical protein BTH42_33465 [Burkholderia sp. SRS-W-2-2016]